MNNASFSALKSSAREHINQAYVGVYSCTADKNKRLFASLNSCLLCAPMIYKSIACWHTCKLGLLMQGFSYWICWDTWFWNVEPNIYFTYKIIKRQHGL